ncbi:MAG: DUF1365 domain-containing protein [Rhodospirillales bacterium]|nr:DUF1365 domain-containing protein [Rhodospirillales bacterium]
MMVQSAIYTGTVVHCRMRPKFHRFRYSVFAMLVDLDELPILDKRYRLFGYNRFAPISFYDRDHGTTGDQPLRPWIEERLVAAGLARETGPVRVLCYPRLFGFVFNPISTYFCYRADGGLSAILYEVCNTYKERHTYVIPVDPDANGMIRQKCPKKMYVSPFIDLHCTYNFRIAPPQETATVIVHQSDNDGFFLSASFKGNRAEISDSMLTRVIFKFPLMTLKVVAGIHWQALRLWLKGLRVFRHQPARQAIASSNGIYTNNRE